MGTSPAFSFLILDSSLSAQKTWWPIPARQAPDTSPTYPHPMTAMRKIHSLPRNEMGSPLTVIFTEFVNRSKGNSKVPSMSANALYQLPLKLEDGWLTRGHAAQANCASSIPAAQAATSAVGSGKYARGLVRPRRVNIG